MGTQKRSTNPLLFKWQIENRKLKIENHYASQLVPSAPDPAVVPKAGTLSKASL